MNKKLDKKNFIWNFLGLTVNSFSSLFFLIIVNRINGQHDAGIFTYAYSIISLFFIIGVFCNRTFQISDTKYSNKEYIYGKVLTCSLMIFITILMIIVFRYNFYKSIIILIICLFRAIDAFSDTLYGITQKEGKLYKSGISLFMKGFFGVVAFYIVDKISNNLVLACLVLPVINILFVYFYDYKNAKNYIKKNAKWKNAIKLLKETTPIFIFSFLGLYLVNSSKYTLDFYSTPEIQNIFGIILMPGTILSLCCQYLMNPYLLKLTTLYKNDKLKEFTKQLVKICSYIVIFGLLCEIGCYVLGIPILNLIYGFDLSPYKYMLMLIVLGSIFMAVSLILSSALTILHENRKQVYIYTIDSIISFILSIVLVKNYGLMGATFTYLIIMLLQVINYIILYNVKIKNKRNI